MTARCIKFWHDPKIEYCGNATVVLTPSWLGRLFGARIVSVDLTLMKAGWVAVATGRDLDHIPHGSAIRDALDFREVVAPSRWELPCGTEAIAP